MWALKTQALTKEPLLLHRLPNIQGAQTFSPCHDNEELEWPSVQAQTRKREADFGLTSNRLEQSENGHTFTTVFPRWENYKVVSNDVYRRLFSEALLSTLRPRLFLIGLSRQVKMLLPGPRF